MVYFLFFDIETTGLLKAKKNEIDYRKHELFPEIIQISWQLQEYSKSKFTLLDSKNYIIRPDGFSIPKDSAAIHGITTERAMKEGADKKEVLEEFVTALMVNPKTYLVCHNIEFDVTILFYHLYKHFKSAFSKYMNLKIPCICTMLDSIGLCKLPSKSTLKYPKKNPTPNDLYKYPKLSELYKVLFDREPSGRLHDSSYDVECLVECFKELISKERADYEMNVRYASFILL